MNKKIIDQNKEQPSVHTVQAYVNALKESYLFYEIKRFDIRGKEYLKTLGKYYIVDTGLRNYLLGYDAAIGKINTLESDFIASNTDEKNIFKLPKQ